MKFNLKDIEFVISEIQKEYVCELTPDGELGMSANDGYELLIERLIEYGI